MKIRARKQLETAKKKGRVSADIFEVDDEVRLQDVSTKKWNKVGEIIKSGRRWQRHFICNSYGKWLRNNSTQIPHQA